MAAQPAVTLTDSSASKKPSSKPKGPAPYTFDDLILIRATVPEVIQQTWTNNMEEWAKGVPLPQYHARERLLASTAFSSEGRLITWVLVPKPDADVTTAYKEYTTAATENQDQNKEKGVRGGFDPEDVSEENLDRILAAVETYERPGIVATSGEGDDSIKEVSSMSVASVYAPSKYRNHGYGKLMMRLLWQEIGNKGASFSFLYSDLGPHFYGNFGWTARTSTEIVIPPAMALPSPRPTCTSATENTKTMRASTKNVALESVTAESLQELVEHDAQLLRETMKSRVQNEASKTTFVAVTPEVCAFQWLHARAWFYAKNIRKSKDAELKELNYGVHVPGTKDEFVLWHHDFTDDNLFILRWRIGASMSLDNTDDSDATALAFVQAAQQEAKKWKISKIVYWNADESLAKLLNLEIKYRNHSIPCLGFLEPSKYSDKVEWVMNEKYSW
ncbi:hypothetical protein BGZ51_005181 [Haplosporangium sp. Z 767]|nr:hypothetical protein BGZ50_007143 [Haplosporangium sp. Z 11]KAF9181786.1 hypothetical protein BGZ51_005181 [Haplosporangium sp. Z 767]